MAKPKTQHVSAAADDMALRKRLIAAAALQNIPDPERWVDQNRYALVTAQGRDIKITIAAAYGQAKDSFPGLPGENPDAVTDDHLQQAVEMVRATPPNG